MEIIVPAAGLSTRFPGMRPKYTLTDYSGKLMIESAIAPYVSHCNITIGILEQHHLEHSVSQYVSERNHNTQFVILPKVTQGPADTVRQIIETASIDLDAPILIRDCDSFFDHEHMQTGNYICVSNVADHAVLKRLGAKSFVNVNEQGVAVAIVEKQIVSNLFCVGGYKFSSARMFVNAYNELAQTSSEIFVSHVIQHCIQQGEVFNVQHVKNYVDVGTAEEWHAYNDKSVLFCDIDGTVIVAQSREEFGQIPTPLVNNCCIIQDLVRQGHQLIFTTARPRERHDEIYQMLEQLGFENFQLITGLINTKRIVINDYNAANPHPRAIAVNIPRDSDTIGDFL